MNGNRCVAALAVTMSSFVIACGKGSTAKAEQGAPSQGAVDRGLASGEANTGGPFQINVTGSKTASASGNDASFCVSSGSTKVFALSLVGPGWAVSITRLGDRPGAGSHPLSSDMSKGLMTDLTDKTTGPRPIDWVHHEVKSGTLILTRSDDSKLEGTYELIAVPGAGGELRAKGKFEANPVKC
jgi:hypothetical protein